MLFRSYPLGLSNFDGVSHFNLPPHETWVSYSETKISTDKTIDCQVRKLSTLMKKFNHEKIDLLKMDIEGSEYEVIDSIIHIPDTVRQFCVEFHHFCTNKTIEDTKNCILKIKSLGFNNFVEKPSTKELNELTFWR